MRIKRSNRCLPISIQVQAMANYFPQFKLKFKNHYKAIWEGILKPNMEMDEHKIIVEYKLGEHPKVYAPTWVKKCTHMFKDHSLCLYFKNRENWNPMMHIASTIIPWSSQWLLFNEFYNITEKFGALEIEHSRGR